MSNLTFSVVDSQVVAIKGFGTGSLMVLCGFGTMHVGRLYVNWGSVGWDNGGVLAALGSITLCVGRILQGIGAAATLTGTALNVLSLVLLADVSGGLILNLIVVAGIAYSVYIAIQGTAWGLQLANTP